MGCLTLQGGDRESGVTVAADKHVAADAARKRAKLDTARRRPHRSWPPPPEWPAGAGEPQKRSSSPPPSIPRLAHSSPSGGSSLCHSDSDGSGLGPACPSRGPAQRPTPPSA